jgi:excinuclease ABC subunit B
MRIERDQLTLPAGVAEEGAAAFVGNSFKATLRDLENRMRVAAANLEFEEAARLRDGIKRLKLLDLEFANDVLAASADGGDR